MKSRIAIALTGLAIIGVSSMVVAQEYGGKLAMNAKEPFGEYLTDEAGRALYILEEDKKGQSVCYEKCTEIWPPYVVNEPIEDDMIDTIKREDGNLQVTFNDMPLYYYVKDEGRAGSTEGHDVHDEFGEWYLVSPSGKKIEG
jgi:predicted lipoprotein with Yx(FWY)xxD motif